MGTEAMNGLERTSHSC